MSPQPASSVARRRRRSRAQGLVEFAILGPLFFLTLFGIIEMGRLVWTNHELTNGTREAARYAMVHGSKSGALATNTDVKAQLRAKSTGIDNTVSVTVSYAGKGDPGEVVTVSSSYVYKPAIYYILKRSSITLTSTSKVIVQH